MLGGVRPPDFFDALLNLQKFRKPAKFRVKDRFPEQLSRKRVQQLEKT